MTARIQTDSITLPSCPEAERALIAAVIDAQRDDGTREIDVIALAGGSGITDCFESERHRKVWSLLCERHAAGKPNGLLDVVDACREAGIEFADRLVEAELLDWLTSFGSQFASASVSPLGYAAANAKEVRETAERRRKMILLFEALQRANADRAPLGTWLPGIAEELGKVGADTSEAATPIAKFVPATMDAVAEICSGGRRRNIGVPTGIHSLDHMIGGGLQPGRVTLIGGRTSQGKSALAVTIATQAALAGLRSVYVSMEMPGTEVGQRILAQMADVPATALHGGPISPDQLGRLSRAAARLSETQLRIIDDDNSWPSILARLHREIAGGAKIIFLDYLQLIQIPGAKLDQWQVLGRITAEVKALALRAKIPIVVVAQLNREAAKESRPRLHHLRGSGDLEQDADCVVLIYRETGQDGKAVNDNADLMLEKNRSGQTGIASVRWNGPLMRFEDWDARAYDGDA